MGDYFAIRGTCKPSFGDNAIGPQVIRTGNTCQQVTTTAVSCGGGRFAVGAEQTVARTGDLAGFRAVCVYSDQIELQVHELGGALEAVTLAEA